MDIAEAKRRLPLRTLALSLGLEVPERDGQAAKCWFPERHANGDRSPSFNIHGDRFRCFGCNANGDGIDLLAEVLGLDRIEATREFKRRAGAVEEDAPKTEAGRPKEEEPRAWPELREGTVEELQALARLRGLSVHGLALAGGMGVLRFGRVAGQDAWLVTDGSGRVAEARRMDGGLFFGKRKPHALKGSRKGWPVGLLPKHSSPALFRRVLLVEGQPDLMAGFHFAERFGALTWLPVAMLGRTCRIAADALPLFAGRHVRIVPHLDPDGGGIEAARRWAEELRGAGATVDFYRLPEGLRRMDGKPVKDLCDLANVADNAATRDLFKI